MSTAGSDSDSEAPKASAHVIREWQNRIAAEYCSAALTADLLHNLIVLGVSPDTLADCHRIVSDELRHAELSREVALAAGATGAAIALKSGSMSLPQGPLLESTLFYVSEFFCCGETVARPLFRAMLANAKRPLAVRAVEVIIKDEARHSAFGWQLLDELLERAPEPLRLRLRERVPTHIERLRNIYGEKPDAAPSSLTTDDLEWGLLLPNYAKRGLA